MGHRSPWSLGRAANASTSPCGEIVPIPLSAYFKEPHLALSSSKKRPFLLLHDENRDCRRWISSKICTSLPILLVIASPSSLTCVLPTQREPFSLSPLTFTPSEGVLGISAVSSHPSVACTQSLITLSGHRLPFHPGFWQRWVDCSICMAEPPNPGLPVPPLQLQ